MQNDRTDMTGIDRDEPKTDRPRQTRQTLSRRRLWAFRFILLLVFPLVLLTAVEWTMRIAGYGFSDRAALEYNMDGKRAYCDNAHFTRLFFPPSLAREFDPFVFFAEKPENTYRIFVLGASAAQGFPAGEYAFGRILEIMLEHRYPETDFEVINVAAVAINSHAVLKIAKECAEYDPDLFVVYLGNNEVVGPYGAGTVFSSIMSNVTLVRLQLAFRSLRIGQWLTDLIQPAMEEDRPKVWRGMEMFLDRQVRHDAEKLETVYHHFEENLRAICDVAVDAGIKAVFSTVCANLRDSPPFGSLHRVGLPEGRLEEWDSLYAEGIAFESEGHFGNAVASYRAAAEIDDTYADLQYRLARCLGALSDHQAAREAYQLAREYDTLRFRADMRINRIIRTLAGKYMHGGIHLVDAARIFEEECSDNIPGREWFYEHVHLNFSGNHLLATCLFEEIDLLLPENVRAQETRVESPLDEEGCRRRLANSSWDRFCILDQVLETLITRPPFTHQLYYDRNLVRLHEERAALKAQLNPSELQEIASLYGRAIQARPQDWWLHWKYARFLNLGLNDSQAAFEEYGWVKDRLPHSYRALSQYGLMLAKLGKSDEAVTVNRKTLEINPFCADAHYSLGLTYTQMERMDDAIAHYRQAIDIKPNHIESYSNLGILLFQKGKASEAITVCRDGLAFAPEDLHLNFNLAIMLEKEGALEEAAKQVATLLEYHPDFLAGKQLADAIANERVMGDQR